MQKLALTIALLTGVSITAYAQTIERIKMTDNELSCQQIYGESAAMEVIITTAGQQNADALAAQASQAVAAAQSAQTAQNAAVATNTALGIAARFGGFGGFGGLFGSAAQSAAQLATDQQTASALQQAAAIPVAQGAVAAQPAQNLQGQQAQARKEHLTSLFLSKGCKMSEISK